MVDYGKKWEDVMSYVGLDVQDLNSYDTFVDAVRKKDYQQKMGGLINSSKLQNVANEDIERNMQQEFEDIKIRISREVIPEEIERIELKDFQFADYQNTTFENRELNLRRQVGRAKSQRIKDVGFLEEAQALQTPEDLRAYGVSPTRFTYKTLMRRFNITEEQAIEIEERLK